MEGTLVLFGALIGLGLVVLVIVLPIVALVRSRKAMRFAKQTQESWQALTQRVHALEAQAQEIQLRSTQQAFALDMALQQLKEVATKLDGVTPGAVAAPPKPPVTASGAEAPPAETPRPAVVVTPSQAALTIPSIPARNVKSTDLPHVSSPIGHPPTAKPPAPPIPPSRIGVLGAPNLLPGKPRNDC